MSKEKVLSLWRMAGNNSEAEEAKTAAVKAAQLMRSGTMRFGPGSFNSDWSETCIVANLALGNIPVDQPLSKDARDQAMHVATMVATVETLVILDESDADLPPPRMDGDEASFQGFDIGQIFAGFAGPVRHGGVAPAAVGAAMGSFLATFLATRESLRSPSGRAKNPVVNPFDLFEQWKQKIGAAVAEPAPKTKARVRSKTKKRATAGKKKSTKKVRS